MVKFMSRKLDLQDTKNCLYLWRAYKDQQAATILIESNMGLVRTIANKYKSSGLSFEELVSAGREGLFNAINKFDFETRDMEGFSSYIGISIENGIRQELRKYRKHSHVLSFDQPLGQNKDGDELKIEDIIGTDADELMENIISEIKNEALRDALNCLTTREKRIIFLRYGLDDASCKTQEEIAEMFDCSRTSIAKQEARALTKMRHPKNTRKIKDFLD